MARSVGSITADLIARTKRFEAGMNKARGGLRGYRGSTNRARQATQNFNRIARRMLGIVGALAGARGLQSMVQSAMRMGAELSNLSRQLNINIEAMQVYNGLMRNAGGTQEQMTSALQRMQQAIVQGGDGLTTYTRAFDRLNLNVDDLAKLRPEEQFERIAQAVANAENQQQALTAVSEIFGRSAAPQLMTVLNRLGTEGYANLAGEIRRTFGIMDQETADRLEEAGNRIEQFRTRMTIRLGEIIVGDQNFAALKELGYRMMSVAEQFGLQVVRGLVGAVSFANTAFADMFNSIVYRFSNALNDAIDAILERIDPRGRIADVSQRVVDATIGRLPENMQSAARIGAFGLSPGLGLAIRGVEGLAQRGSGEDREVRRPFLSRVADQISEAADTAFDFIGDWQKTTDLWSGMAQDQREVLDKAAKERAKERETLRRIVTGVAPTAADEVSVPRVGPMMPAMASASAAPLLTGDALRRAASQAGGRDIRFERMATGGFQRFFQGRAAGMFGEAQLQKSLGMAATGDMDIENVQVEQLEEQRTMGFELAAIRDILESLRLSLLSVN